MTCFDNNSLRWAFQAFSSAVPPTDLFVQRVGNYILSLDQADQKVVIPAIVLFEFLVIEPENEHHRLIAGFAERFEIIPFDFRTASIAATLQARRTNSNQNPSTTSTPKQVLKVDCMIAATAIAAGASEVLTHDRDFEKLLQGSGVKVKKVSELPLPQPTLPFPPA